MAICFANQHALMLWTEPNTILCSHAMQQENRIITWQYSSGTSSLCGWFRGRPPLLPLLYSPQSRSSLWPELKLAHMSSAGIVLWHTCDYFSILIEKRPREKTEIEKTTNYCAHLQLI